MYSLNRIYRMLFRAYGPQGWWPGRTGFEIAVGAILTQNVAWKNVEQAIAELKKRRVLTPMALDTLQADQIAPLIRSVGYYNRKAEKLKHFLKWFCGHGYRFSALRGMEPESIRKELLAVNGIGPETADSILLYALAVKTFVVDAYTRRIFVRLGHLGGDERYEEVRSFFHRRFRGTVQDYNEFHALIVEHGKEVCRTSPRCGGCVLAKACPAVQAVAGTF